MQLDTGADIITVGVKIWQKLPRPKLKPYVATCTDVFSQPIQRILLRHSKS